MGGRGYGLFAASRRALPRLCGWGAAPPHTPHATLRAALLVIGCADGWARLRPLRRFAAGAAAPVWVGGCATPHPPCHAARGTFGDRLRRWVGAVTATSALRGGRWRACVGGGLRHPTPPMPRCARHFW